MTRKRQTPEDGKSRKRILKPVVEKKRRDRINQSLAELRRLLLLSTSDPRLQNPKIEKAEILDLAVEYLKKWADRKDLNNDLRPPAASGKFGPAESRFAPFVRSESAGFQQCMAQLNSYMHRIPPTQRTSLTEGLKHHSASREPRFNSVHGVWREPEAASGVAVCPSEGRGESPWLLFPPHPSFQPLSCSTPCHDYLSPPPSPWFSPSFSTFTASPPFPSFACPLAFPPSLSPPSSSNASFLRSISPTLPHASPLGLHVPPLTSLIPQLHLPHREVSPADSLSPVWRPWMG
ncbi:transcription factor HES-7-like [Xiphophorus couchianus]|uniref:transcription factor HES-7-like n=1 Tax=Xiphophorus couchianus TaxID=32473 RepID=UPI0010169751|nr:transcription factor HES-7-like [Xiphophorus couchianus]